MCLEMQIHLYTIDEMLIFRAYGGVTSVRGVNVHPNFVFLTDGTQFFDPIVGAGRGRPHSSAQLYSTRTKKRSISNYNTRQVSEGHPNKLLVVPSLNLTGKIRVTSVRRFFNHPHIGLRWRKYALGVIEACFNWD